MQAQDPSTFQHRLDRAHWRVEGRIATVVGLIAFVLAFVITVLGPTGYFALAWQANARDAEVTARLYASTVTLRIAGQVQEGTVDWQYDAQALIETDLVDSLLPERRTIVDRRDIMIAQAYGHGWNPVVIREPFAEIERRAPILVGTDHIADVLVSRDLSPLIGRTVLVALLSLALGLAIYGAAAALPMRSLRRTLAALRNKEAQGRREAEDHLRIVFENVVEGILILGAGSTVMSGNPASARIFGLVDVHDLAGRDLRELIGPLVDDGLSNPYPNGGAEGVGFRLDGQQFPLDITISDSRVMGRGNRIAIVRDITERKLAEARLSHLANFDSLTGLPNRTRFRSCLEQAARKARIKGRPFVLMFLDLDRFKTINDSLGHEVGDRLLQRVARTLAQCVEAASHEIGVAPGLVSRLGGDEFTVLVEGVSKVEAVGLVAERILAALNVPFVIGEHELFISASIGLVASRGLDGDLDSLIKQADIAMYRSKERGRNTFTFYTDQLDATIAERLRLETALRHAFERDEFRLCYQPKIDFGTGRTTGVEALLRWTPTDASPVAPDRFVPILEETGLISQVGAWVLRQACQQVMVWTEQGIEPIGLAVNLSARQFRQPDLFDVIARTLADTGLPPSRLEIELTESMLIDEIDEAVKILQRLGAMGIRIAIDDFGTGHSSLSYLKKFDLDTLKIDRSFVQDAPDSAADRSIASAVIELAHGLGLTVVAEGVENERQANFLRSQGCDQLQGYLISPPMEPAAAFTWLRQHQRGGLVHSPGSPDPRPPVAAPPPEMHCPN